MNDRDNWRKSSYSANGSVQCVEAANGGNGVLVRDTSDREGAVLAVTPSAWAAFTACLRA
jgi:uncharacterized protein DUF397